jgi:hypothetical protein
MLSEEDGTVD